MTARYNVGAVRTGDVASIDLGQITSNPNPPFGFGEQLGLSWSRLLVSLANRSPCTPSEIHCEGTSC